MSFAILLNKYKLVIVKVRALDIINSFVIESERFYYYDIKMVIDENKKLRSLPIVLKILLEENLRNAKDSIEFNKVVNIFSNRINSHINLYSSRIMLNESIAIPTFVDLASMREENSDLNPYIMTDVLLDSFSSDKKEKYKFLKWASNSFSNFRIVGTNNEEIKALNYEALSTILHIDKKDDKFFLYPETVLGLNSFGVLGLQVNSIDIKKAILGSSIFIDFPKVVGFEIKADFQEEKKLDILDSINSRLKEHDLKGKIVEFFGDGLKYLSLEDRARLLKSSFEFKALSFFFAIDDDILEYFNKTRESKDFSQLISKYLELQEMLYNDDEVLEYDEYISLDLNPLNIIEKEFEEEVVLYKELYENLFNQNEFWKSLEFEESKKYLWSEESSYIQSSNFFDKQNLENIDIRDASILALFGDDISTENISSMKQISLYSSSAKYLESKGIKSFEYGTFSSRSMNSKLMVRGLFDTKDVHNKMISKEGAFTIDYETGEIIPLYEKALKFKEQKRDFVIFAGENYGNGSSKEWAAKGIRLLGVKAIIAKSFGEEHRIDLINFGVLPLEFIDDDIDSLNLKGKDTISVNSEEIKVDSKIDAIINKSEISINIELKCRLDTQDEVEIYKNGGVFSYLLNK